MSALDVQIGGGHYKTFAVQPCVLMNTFLGPAAHILSYIVRTKGADDLDKAVHWCDLAIENGMHGIQAALESAVDDANPHTIDARDWLWQNGYIYGSFRAEAVLALEVGDYQRARGMILQLIEQEKGAVVDEHETMFDDMVEEGMQ